MWRNSPQCISTYVWGLSHCDYFWHNFGNFYADWRKGFSFAGIQLRGSPIESLTTPSRSMSATTLLGNNNELVDHQATNALLTGRISLDFVRFFTELTFWFNFSSLKIVKNLRTSKLATNDAQNRFIVFKLKLVSYWRSSFENLLRAVHL
jgi:hypothetical protein